ncbi:uncharacterized protein VP01_160g9 [Puccinia sorghi]|uniref:rRNA-processing protein n=1 Tax=Puccinia sorghi TaxID=27349 RepID=A0A0L6VH41_9BASI|nr:uncharacterized protein VP01_160g9 [Puccinia sorghi]
MIKGQKESASWHSRQAERKKREAVQQLERTLRTQQEAAREEKLAKIKARKLKLKEKERLASLASKISAKKLLRLRNRQGRSKKIAG